MGATGIETARLEPCGASVSALFGACAAESDIAPKTAATYARSLRQWAAFLDARGLMPLEATRADVLEYKAELIGDGKSAATVSAYLTAVRTLYAWLESRGAYPNIAAGIRGPKRAKQATKDALTVEQAARVLQSNGDTAEAKRDAAMIALMMRRGLRTVEIARANVGDLRQIAGRAVLDVRGKGYGGDVSGYVVLGEVETALHEWLQARGEAAPDAPLFVGLGNRNRGGRLTSRTVSRIAKGALEAAGMHSARLTAHSMRHTAVTFALLGGASVQEAQAMARHANIETTMVYAHNIDRIQAGAECSVDRFIAAQLEHECDTARHAANSADAAERGEGETRERHGQGTARHTPTGENERARSAGESAAGAA